MILDLDREDLMALVLGSHVNYYNQTVYDNIINSKLGSVWGGMGERFEWNKAELNKIDDTGLYNIYIFLKQNKK